MDVPSVPSRKIDSNQLDPQRAATGESTKGQSALPRPHRARPDAGHRFERIGPQAARPDAHDQAVAEQARSFVGVAINVFDEQFVVGDVPKRWSFSMDVPMPAARPDTAGALEQAVTDLLEAEVGRLGMSVGSVTASRRGALFRWIDSLLGGVDSDAKEKFSIDVKLVR